ncbi:unnamed protein product [Amoebophrya sp. A25]|nr:unnamed protein product [Amoebophrya sp. A25]|eukprot:GSA25T00013591001.1
MTMLASTASGESWLPALRGCSQARRRRRAGSTQRIPPLQVLDFRARGGFLPPPGAIAGRSATPCFILLCAFLLPLPAAAQDKNTSETGILLVVLSFAGIILLGACIAAKRYVRTNVVGDSNADRMFQLETKLENMVMRCAHFDAHYDVAVGAKGPLQHPTLDSLDKTVWKTRVVDKRRNCGKAWMPEHVEYDNSGNPIVSGKFSGSYRFELDFTAGKSVNISGIGFDEADGTSQTKGFYDESTGVMIFEEKFERTGDDGVEKVRAMVEMVVLGHTGQIRSMRGKAVPSTRIKPSVLQVVEITEGDTYVPQERASAEWAAEHRNTSTPKRKGRVPPKTAAMLRGMSTVFSGVPITVGPTKITPENDFAERVKREERSAIQVQAAARGRMARKMTQPLLEERREAAVKANRKKRTDIKFFSEDLQEVQVQRKNEPKVHAAMRGKYVESMGSEDTCAVKIQAAARGRIVRKKTKSMGRGMATGT